MSLIKNKQITDFDIELQMHLIIEKEIDKIYKGVAKISDIFRDIDTLVELQQDSIVLKNEKKTVFLKAKPLSKFR